jgi:hypothetical protein
MAVDRMAAAEGLVADLKGQLDHLAADESGMVDRLPPHVVERAEEHLRQALFLLEEAGAEAWGGG